MVCGVDRADLLEAGDGAPQVSLMITQDFAELHEQGDAVGRVHGEIHGTRQVFTQLAVFGPRGAQADPPREREQLVLVFAARALS